MYIESFPKLLKLHQYNIYDLLDIIDIFIFNILLEAPIGLVLILNFWKNYQS